MIIVSSSGLMHGEKKNYLHPSGVLCPKDHFKFQRREMNGNRLFQETKSVPSTILFVCEFWFCRHASNIVSSNS
jgi:hypothetical protein